MDACAGRNQAEPLTPMGPPLGLSCGLCPQGRPGPGGCVVVLIMASHSGTRVPVSAVLSRAAESSPRRQPARTPRRILTL